MQTNRTGPVSSEWSCTGTSTRLNFLKKGKFRGPCHRAEWQSLPALCIKSSPICASAPHILTSVPASFLRHRHALERFSAAAEKREWGYSQPEQEALTCHSGTQVCKSNVTWGNAGHSFITTAQHCTKAGQHRCVTQFLTCLLFPPCSYCLSASNTSR